MSKRQTQREQGKSQGETTGVSGFDDFWACYPRRVARLAAQKSYARAIKSGVSHEQIIAGVAAYRRHKPAYADWAYPASWLNQGRWDDVWEDVSVAEKAEPVDWFDECRRLHGLTCNGRYQHTIQMDIDRMKASQ